MSEIAIKVENLSKRYRIGLKEEVPDTFVGTVTAFLSRPLRNFRRLRRLSTFSEDDKIQSPNQNSQPGISNPKSEIRNAQSGDIIWALKDVSFEVKRGEVLGIIGANGAGKSTLLKILSRITHPTSGFVKLNGRVSSLLEVGTGFHGEMTGRENIYLNGTILGMTKDEIDGKFDEIVAFSGVEKFIDTPVKRYSSGMRVRLAFSVAAHLEPEILLIDEVLAVGDAEFQKKCLGKMDEVSRKGRTILFVSHDMSAIESLCSRAMLIDNGYISLDGISSEVVSSYLMDVHAQVENPLLDCPRKGNGKLRITSFHLESPKGKKVELAKSGSAIVFAFDFINYSCSPEDEMSFSFSIHTGRGKGLFHYYSHFSNVYFKNIPDKGTVRCLVPELPLAPGNYLVGFRVVMNGNLRTGEEVDWPQVLLPISVVAADFYGVGSANLSNWGPILVKGEWSMVKDEENIEI